MNTYHSEIGTLTVGDVVRFSHASGVKKGTIVSIEDSFHRVNISIYHTDSTGGYAMSVPPFNIIEVINNKVEDIKKPTRYNKRGVLECWDVILDQEMNFIEGSVLKYLWRYKEKNGIHDLEKAKVYIDKLIKEIEKK